MKKLPLLIVLFASSILSFAQDEIFKVLINKGSNKVITAPSNSSQDLIVGKKIFATDKIVLATGGYLGLTHKSGKTIELKTPGTYEVSKLKDQVASQNASVSSKYVNYIADQIIDNNESMSANRYKHMAVTGSVERGTDKIKPMTLNQSIVLDELILIKWNKVKIDSQFAKTYVVTFMNMFDETLTVKETTDTQLVINLSKLNIKTVKNIVWFVKVKDSNPVVQSDKYSLQYIGDEKKATDLHNQFSSLKTELSEQTALNKLILASFFAENNLPLNAMNYFEEAIKLEPEVDEYKIVYGKYLSDTGLSKSTK